MNANDNTLPAEPLDYGHDNDPCNVLVLHAAIDALSPSLFARRKIPIFTDELDVVTAAVWKRMAGLSACKIVCAKCGNGGYMTTRGAAETRRRYGYPCDNNTVVVMVFPCCAECGPALDVTVAEILEITVH